MKNVSPAYSLAQQSHSIRPVRRIELFRRLGSGAGWEAVPIVITPEIERLERLAWKLDTDALNEFKASNLALDAENTFRQWDESSSRFSGFNRYQSLVRIFVGLNVAGGDETFPVFTGVIEDVAEDSRAPKVRLEVLSLERVLERADAEKAALQVANELVAIGDGVTAEFPLAQFPVGGVKEVRVAGAVARPVIDWTVSGLSEFLVAKLRFENVQPSVGQEIRCDYFVWRSNLQLHELVNALLDTLPQIQRQVVETAAFDPFQRRILHNKRPDFLAYDLRRAEVLAETPPPEDDGLITINPYDTQSEWLGREISTNINFKRVPSGITPKWTAQLEGDFRPSQEYLQAENDGFQPWSEIDPGVNIFSTAGVLIFDHSSGAYFAMSNRGGTNAANKTLFVRCRIERLDSGGVVEFMVGATAVNTGVVIRFDNLNNVKVRTGISTSPAFPVDTTTFHTYRLDLTITGPASGSWTLSVDGVVALTGSASNKPFMPGVNPVPFETLLRSDGNNRFHLDFLRQNGEGFGPATGQITVRVNYAFILSLLVVRAGLTTLGKFFSQVQGSPTIPRYFFSFLDNITGFSGETEVFPTTSNLGSFVSSNQPLEIRMRISLTDEVLPLLSAVQKLWLPAIFESPEIDGGDAVEWEKLETVSSANNGQIRRYSYVRGIFGDPFAREIPASNLITSDNDFFAAFNSIPRKMGFIFLMNTSGSTPPVLNSNLIILQTKSLILNMANVGGRSVLDVIKEAAGLADFEFGFTGDGRFFFRKKPPSAAVVLTLDDSNLLSVDDIRPGWDRVFNIVSATFGAFTATITPLTQGEASPNSIERFGARRLAVGGGSLAFQTDVDLATILAKRYYASYKEPKRRVALTARYLPEIELGDLVRYNLLSPRQIGQSFNAKVLGIAHDLMGFKTELDLLEAG